MLHTEPRIATACQDCTGLFKNQTCNSQGAEARLAHAIKHYKHKQRTLLAYSNPLLGCKLCTTGTHSRLRAKCM